MMEEHFRQFLSKDDARQLAGVFTLERYAAKEFFIEMSQYSRKVAFVSEGLARSYYLNLDGRETTVCFSSEGMMLLDPVAFYSSGKAKFTIQFLQDSLVYTIFTRHDHLDRLNKSNPHISALTRKMLEESYVFLINRILSHQTKSAEERYKELMEKNADLFLRIPLKYIASYLGITESSLSRIRRNIVL